MQAEELASIFNINTFKVDTFSLLSHSFSDTLVIFFFFYFSFL